MAELVERYADLPVGTVDASFAATAERRGQSTIATLDRRHLTVLRPTRLERSRSFPEQPKSPRIVTELHTVEKRPGTGLVVNKLPIHTPSNRNGVAIRQKQNGLHAGGSETGATGLEPATSGVTGRHGGTGYNRLRPGITG